MKMLERKTLNGMEEVKGRIINGYGVYKNNNRFCCIILEGINKGIAICDCSTLKLIKEFISKLEDITNVKDLNENNYNSDISNKIAKLRNEYWIL